MLSGKIRMAAMLGLVALGLSACADIQQRFYWRWGPDPTLPASHFDGVLDNQLVVIAYIECRAHLGMTVPTTDPGCANEALLTSLSPSQSQYQNHFQEVAHWGFNVGRQDCETYMNVLFKLNREKGRNDTIIAQVGSATAAIVGVAASSPSTTLSILAAVFGLTTALNDAYFNTYLFSEAPGLVGAKVLDLQTSYANKLKPTDTATPAGAYAAIQKYYQLCLPESIEGVLRQAVADTKAQTTDTKGPAKDTKLVATSAAKK